MRAVKQDKYGGPEALYMGENKMPELGSKQVLVEVHGTAVNRADLLMVQDLFMLYEEYSIQKNVYF